MSQSPNSAHMSVREKLERKIYDIEACPRILFLKRDEISVNKKAPHPDAVESFENLDWARDGVVTKKLKASSWGNWQFDVSEISKEHFESREKMEDLFIEESLRTFSQSACVSFERISLPKIAKLMDLNEFTANMDFYMSNRKEMEKDLGRPVGDADLKDNSKRLEQELFYNQMRKLLGSVDDDFDVVKSQTEIVDDLDHHYGKTLIVRDFKILSADGNNKYATGSRGDFYLLFTFMV